MKWVFVTIMFVSLIAMAANKTDNIAHTGGEPAAVKKAAPAVKPNKIKELEKTPKSLFLIKKIKVSPEVGEPQFDPAEAQLRTVINDPVLQNLKKFE